MFTEKDLIAGETVLVSKGKPITKKLYLGRAGIVHFISTANNYEEVGICFTIKDLIKYFDIEQPKSKVVPLEKKVYDFVPVKCKYRGHLVNCYLIAVYPNSSYPYKVITENGDSDGFEYCEFINEK